MKRLGRFRFMVYSILPLLVLLGGARLVLSSGFAANRVANRLAVLLGVPVRVSGVDIALGGSSDVQGLQIYEAENTRPDAPWATAEAVQADFSAVDILDDDAMPKVVVLNGGKVVLRFAADGTFLTRLPKSSDATQKMPKLRLDNAQLTLEQAGRETPLVLTGVNAEFSYEDRAFRFEGTCTDPFWGEWQVNGAYHAGSGVFQLSLRAESVTVDAEKLSQLPFVPRLTWEQVVIHSGRTSVNMDLTVTPDAPIHYRVVLLPVETRLHVASIDLDAENASGEVVIEDSVVRLSQVKGRTANGTIEMESVFDYRGADSVLKFARIAVEKVELQKLPDSWGMKEHKIQGKLTGKAELSVVIKAETVETKGSGKGVVNEGIYRNLPILAPIAIKLDVNKGKVRIFPSGTGFFPGL